MKTADILSRQRLLSNMRPEFTARKYRPNAANKKALRDFCGDKPKRGRPTNVVRAFRREIKNQCFFFILWRGVSPSLSMSHNSDGR